MPTPKAVNQLLQHFNDRREEIRELGKSMYTFSLTSPESIFVATSIDRSEPATVINNLDSSFFTVSYT